MLESITKSLLFKKVKHLIFGSVSSQLLTIAVMPLLTRVYSSEEFGSYALFLSLIGVLSVFSTFRYERGIVVVKSDLERTAVFYLTLAIAVASIPTMYFIFVLWGHFSSISKAPIQAVINGFPLILALAIGLSGIESALTYHTLKSQRYGILGVTQATRSASQALFQIGFAFYPVFCIENGLIFGAVLAPIVAIGILSSRLDVGKLTDLNADKARLNSLKNAAKNNSLYPKYMVWSALCNSLTNHALVLAVGALFSVGSAGSIFLAYRVLMIPAKVLAKNISLINLQEASDLTGHLISEMYKRRLRKFLMAGLLPLLAALAAAPWAFAIVFGNEWREAGVVAQLLAPSLYLQFVFTSFISLFTAVRAQKTYLFWSILRLLLIVIGLFLGAHLADLWGAVIGFSVALIISYIVVHYLILRSLRLFITSPSFHG